MYGNSNGIYNNGNYNTLPMSAQLGYFFPINGIYCIDTPSQRQRQQSESSLSSLNSSHDNNW